MLDSLAKMQDILPDSVYYKDMKIYTKKGDLGQTSLLGGTRVSKNHWRLYSYGELDELNSMIGLALVEMKSLELLKETPQFELLHEVQNCLFNIGSHLACENDDFRPRLPKLDHKSINQLESSIDQMDAELPPLKQFILPGGTRAGATLHVARTVARRCERHCVAANGEQQIDPFIIQYLNRLSDFLFVVARYCNWLTATPEVHWNP